MSLSYTPAAARRIVTTLFITQCFGSAALIANAAADAQIPDRRARAISMVVFAGTVGAIAGPALVQPSGLVLGSLTFDPLAGPMWSGALLFGLAGLLIVAFLRPDPRDIGRAIAIAQPETQSPAGVARPLGEIMRQPAAWLAL